MMDTAGPVTRRFPLVARPRPACTALPDRIADLCSRAETAAHTGNPATAAAVFNLAALLASDCGLPELARTWCHRLASAALDHDPDPRHGLEPIVNLARLHMRASHGQQAWNLLEELFRAVDTRTDTVIDGLTIPIGRLTSNPSVHAQVRSWLWTVLLATGAPALASAGRWEDARHRLAEYRGVGARMFDGRQITILAHALTGRRHDALTMLSATQAGDPWENAVTACLAALLADDDSAGLINAALTAHRDLGLRVNGLTVFRTRLGLTLLDALGADDPGVPRIAAGLIRDAAGDGYAARDVLGHPGCLTRATHRQARRLVALVDECGLDAGALAEARLTRLADALDVAETVITQQRTPTTAQAG